MPAVARCLLGVGDQGCRGVRNMKSKFQIGNRQENGGKRRRGQRTAKKRISLAAIARQYMDLLRLRQKISEVESWHPH